MSFIEEHFDAEVAVAMAIIGAFWGLLRHNDNQSKEYMKHWLERIEESVVEMRKELKELSDSVVCVEQIERINDEISDLQKEINLAREKSVSIERMAKMDLEFEGLRTAIQKTREAMIQASSKESESSKRFEESIVRIEKKIDAKVDEKTCHAFNNKDKKL